MQIARLMVREGDSEDAVQNAILLAWKHLPDLRDENAFDAWLRRILINQCRQIQREYKKEKEAYSALPVGEQKADIAEFGLQEALNGLNEEERKLIALHHEYGYTLKEISYVTGKSEEVLKMSLYRARKRLKVILISLILFVLLASAAIGTGMLDVNWFLQNRRERPAMNESMIEAQSVEAAYTGTLLEFSVSDAVWNPETLSLSFVYSIAGKDAQALIVHGGKIGADGVRVDHIWTGDGIAPVKTWADGKTVGVFTVDGWRLGGADLQSTEDYLSDGLGETFMAELYLNWIKPEHYEKLMDEKGRLVFEANITLKDYVNGEILEAKDLSIKVSAPELQTWREIYEAYYR